MNVIKDFLCPKCGKLLGRYESTVFAAKGYLFLWCRKCHEERCLDIATLSKAKVS